jgi:hypothetical protein
VQDDEEMASKGKVFACALRISERLSRRMASSPKMSFLAYAGGGFVAQNNGTPVLIFFYLHCFSTEQLALTPLHENFNSSRLVEFSADYRAACDDR